MSSFLVNLVRRARDCLRRSFRRRRLRRLDRKFQAGGKIDRSVQSRSRLPLRGGTFYRKQCESVSFAHEFVRRI